jgi:hypothetical protein
VNHLQRQNQRLIRKAVGQQRLLISLHISNGNLVDVESLAREEYWRDSDALLRLRALPAAARFEIMERLKSIARRHELNVLVWAKKNRHCRWLLPHFRALDDCGSGEQSIAVVPVVTVPWAGSQQCRAHV